MEFNSLGDVEFRRVYAGALEFSISGLIDCINFKGDRTVEGWANVVRLQNAEKKKASRNRIRV
jgi:hypothetical protein